MPTDMPPLNYRNRIRLALEQPSVVTVDGLPFPRVYKGKVREVFDAGDYYLIVATDRISAFDVVLPGGIAGKGVLLTQASLRWFKACQDVLPNHLAPGHAERLEEVLRGHPELHLRSMLCRKLNPIRIESVVRGYLSGSAWEAYRTTGHLWGQKLPEGLLESSALPEPLFTPTTKAPVGDKDLPLSLSEAEQLMGTESFSRVREVSLALFRRGQSLAASAGLILADTKFEFGTDSNGALFLIDELLTPDSSRFWPAESWKPGGPQVSFDKQFVRDYLTGISWNRRPPGPALPEAVIRKTQEKYLSLLEILFS